jgi:5-hydroxyisourate hydrolase
MKPPPSSPITSHVLDTALGRPARDLAVRLDVLDEGGAWRTLAERVTGDDGRVADLLEASAFVDPSTFTARTYRLTFATGAYFAASGRAAFYPRVEVIFDVAAPGEHYHIPLLLSPFGYSTYRGS